MYCYKKANLKKVTSYQNFFKQGIFHSVIVSLSQKESVVCLDFKCFSQLISLPLKRRAIKSYNSTQFLSRKKLNLDVKGRNSKEICLRNLIQIQVKMGC